MVELFFLCSNFRITIAAAAAAGLALHHSSLRFDINS